VFILLSLNQSIETNSQSLGKLNGTEISCEMIRRLCRAAIRFTTCIVCGIGRVDPIISIIAILDMQCSSFNSTRSELPKLLPSSTGHPVLRLTVISADSMLTHKWRPITIARTGPRKPPPFNTSFKSEQSFEFERSGTGSQLVSADGSKSKGGKPH
jgi:hypothetical protein